MFRRLFQRAISAGLACASVAASLVATEVKSTADTAPLYHAAHWTVEDGLPQMRISALAQTPDGYLWAGSWFGLARFDGVRFVVFNSANTPELKKESITALAVDRGDGALWIGTPEGVVRLKDRQFTRLAEPHELSASNIADLVPAAGGGVWVWAQDTVVLWRGRLVAVAPLHLASGEGHHSAWETEAGHLVVATGQRCLEVAEDGTMRDWPLPAGAPADPWIAGFRTMDRGRQVWLGTLQGLFRFADGKWRELQAFPPRMQPDHFLSDRAGCVWAACGQAGLFRCDASGVRAVPLDEHGTEKAINCLLEDREGYVWAGTEAGLFQLRPRLLQAYSVAEGLPHRECRSVCEAPDGAIWVETARAVARLQDGHAQTFPSEPGRITRFSVLVDKDATIWMGDDHNGLVAWRPDGKENWFWHDAKPGAVAGVTLAALYLGRSGRVWAGTDRGATWFADGQPTVRWGEQDLPTNSVRSIYQTRDGTMWFGTWQAGAVRWRGADFQSAVSQVSNLRAPATAEAHSANARPADWKSAIQQAGKLRYEATRFTTTNGLADNRVFVFHEDADAALWIGTHNGLSRFKDECFFTFRAEQGLFDPLINWLEEDDAGRLWFSCNRGIFRMDRAELNAVADGRKARATAVVYGVADGMLNPETNGEQQPAGCKARDGRLWFPTSDGVVVVDPRAIKDSDLPPPIVIEQVVADGEVIFGDTAAADLRRLSTQVRNLKSEIRTDPSLLASATTRLSPGRARLLEFRYTANSFADAKRTRFRYRLAPHEAAWREETTDRVAYYTDLRPGEYRFEVKAASARGAWNETPVVFPFSLAPKFSQTIWFPVSGTLAVLAFAGGLAAWRLRWQRRAFQAEKTTALERERGRIARDLHDELGASLTGLALELEARQRRAQPEDAQLAELARSARTLAHNLRELSWTTNPRCDNVGSLGVFLGELTERFCAAAGWNCDLDLPPADDARPVPARLRHDLLAVVKEALTNAAKHARPRTVALKVTVAAGRLDLRVRDDGAGFDPAKAAAGSGLRNLRERVQQAGGSFTADSAPQQGTTITVSVPFEPTQAA